MKNVAVNNAQQQISQLKVEIDSVTKLIVELPDPKDSEKAFLKFMNKNGAKLGAHKAELEKLTEIATKSTEKIADKNSLWMETNVLKDADELIKDILQCIMLFAFLTVLRNNNIRNPQEKTLRDQANNLRQQMIRQSEKDDWWKTFRDEALEILGPESDDAAHGDDDDEKMEIVDVDGDDDNPAQANKPKGKGRGGRKGRGRGKSRGSAPAHQPETSSPKPEPKKRQRRF